jgi:hypothetical protein
MILELQYVLVYARLPYTFLRMQPIDEHEGSSFSANTNIVKQILHRNSDQGHYGAGLCATYYTVDLAHASGRAFKMVSVVFCVSTLILLPQTHTNHHTSRLEGKIKSSSCYFLVLMIQSCHATSWLIVACSGVGSRASWQSWGGGGRHGWWVHGLASFHLGFIACQVYAVHQILAMRCFFFSYINFGTENLALAFLN